MKLSCWLAAPLAALSLAACSDKADTAAGPAAPEAAPRTLAATLDEVDGLDALSDVAERAGLEAVLEGQGPYTVFAPVDGALGAAADLKDDALRAQGAALLRAHIVPGALTRGDIGAAIDRASDGQAKTRTMAGGVLTFSRDGDAIRVAAEDGSAARLTQAEQVATNGVVQPIDALLVKAAPAT